MPRCLAASLIPSLPRVTTTSVVAGGVKAGREIVLLLLKEALQQVRIRPVAAALLMMLPRDCARTVARIAANNARVVAHAGPSAVAVSIAAAVTVNVAVNVAVKVAVDVAVDMPIDVAVDMPVDVVVAMPVAMAVVYVAAAAT